jgi:hypothetical protein
MRIAAVVGALALCAALVGCSAGRSEVLQARWEVVQAEYADRTDGTGAMLLDTTTGETWIQDWDANEGYYWKKMKRADEYRKIP